MAIEIVDLPIFIAWWIFPVRYVKLPEGTFSGSKVGHVACGPHENTMEVYHTMKGEPAHGRRWWFFERWDHTVWGVWKCLSRSDIPNHYLEVRLRPLVLGLRLDDSVLDAVFGATNMADFSRAPASHFSTLPGFTKVCAWSWSAGEHNRASVALGDT
jgi:hypothetical protein